MFFSRTAQVKELCALGFSDEARCHEVLRQSGGEVRGALALLQRPLLEPFHKHIWSDKPEPPVDIHHPDKQVQPYSSGLGPVPLTFCTPNPLGWIEKHDCQNFTFFPSRKL